MIREKTVKTQKTVVEAKAKKAKSLDRGGT